MVLKESTVKPGVKKAIQKLDSAKAPHSARQANETLQKHRRLQPSPSTTTPHSKSRNSSGRVSLSRSTSAPQGGDLDPLSAGGPDMELSRPSAEALCESAVRQT